MKLSEAIRLGAMLGPQAFGSLLVHHNNKPIGYCAMGGALAAVGCLEVIRTSTEFLVRRSTPDGDWFKRVLSTPCPSCGNEWRHVSITNVVEHLNDIHKWTRERIADWVETVERANEPQPETAQAVTA